MNSLEDHKGFGALHRQFWGAGTASAAGRRTDQISALMASLWKRTRCRFRKRGGIAILRVEATALGSSGQKQIGAWQRLDAAATRRGAGDNRNGVFLDDSARPDAHNSIFVAISIGLLMGADSVRGKTTPRRITRTIH